VLLLIILQLVPQNFDKFMGPGKATQHAVVVTLHHLLRAVITTSRHLGIGAENPPNTLNQPKIAV